MALRNASAIEVTPEAWPYAQQIDEAMAGTVWCHTPTAHTYYRSAGGRIVTAFSVPAHRRGQSHRAPIRGLHSHVSELLSSKTALVTGSSRGWGRAIAQRLAAEGATVVVTARSPNRRCRPARHRHHTAGHHRRHHRTDPRRQAAGRPGSPRTSGRGSTYPIGRRVVDRTGRIDILVNNAGFADYSVIENMSMETFDRTVEHYLRTPFVLTQGRDTAYARRAGWIVNIGSVTGLAPASALPGVQQILRRRGSARR